MHVMSVVFLVDLNFDRFHAPAVKREESNFSKARISTSSRCEKSGSYEKVNVLQSEAAAASSTVSISALGKEPFKFSVHSFPNVPFSLKIT